MAIFLPEELCQTSTRNARVSYAPFNPILPTPFFKKLGSSSNAFNCSLDENNTIRKQCLAKRERIKTFSRESGKALKSKDAINIDCTTFYFF